MTTPPATRLRASSTTCAQTQVVLRRPAAAVGQPQARRAEDVGGGGRRRGLELDRRLGPGRLGGGHLAGGRRGLQRELRVLGRAAQRAGARQREVGGRAPLAVVGDPLERRAGVRRRLPFSQRLNHVRIARSSFSGGPAPVVHVPCPPQYQTIFSGAPAALIRAWLSIASCSVNRWSTVPWRMSVGARIRRVSSPRAARGEPGLVLGRRGRRRPAALAAQARVMTGSCAPVCGFGLQDARPTGRWPRRRRRGSSWSA